METVIIGVMGVIDMIGLALLLTYTDDKGHG